MITVDKLKKIESLSRMRGSSSCSLYNAGTFKPERKTIAELCGIDEADVLLLNAFSSNGVCFVCLTQKEIILREVPKLFSNKSKLKIVRCEYESLGSVESAGNVLTLKCKDGSSDDIHMGKNASMVCSLLKKVIQTVAADEKRNTDFDEPPLFDDEEMPTKKTSAVTKTPESSKVSVVAEASQSDKVSVETEISQPSIVSVETETAGRQCTVSIKRNINADGKVGDDSLSGTIVDPYTKKTVFLAGKLPCELKGDLSELQADYLAKVFECAGYEAEAFSEDKKPIQYKVITLDSYDVELEEYGTSKAETIMLVMKECNIRLEEAKAKVEAVPSFLCKKSSKEDAEVFAEPFIQLGAKIKISQKKTEHTHGRDLQAIGIRILDAGQSKIGVIKVLRENMGLGLKEANDCVNYCPGDCFPIKSIGFDSKKIMKELSALDAKAEVIFDITGKKEFKLEPMIIPLGVYPGEVENSKDLWVISTKDKIVAVKEIRALKNASLCEAKDFVDCLPGILEKEIGTGKANEIIAELAKKGIKAKAFATGMTKSEIEKLI